MKEFNLTALMTVSVRTTVYAETLEEAIEIAQNREDMMSITSNNGDSPDEVWMIEELDGFPYEISED